MKPGAYWEKAAVLIALESFWRKQSFRSVSLILALHSLSQATGFEGGRGDEAFPFWSGNQVEVRFCYVKHRCLKVLERPDELVFMVTPFTLLFRSRWWGVGTMPCGSRAQPYRSLMTSVWVFHLLAKRYHTCPDKPFTTTGVCGNTARATGEGKLSEGRNQLH